jgi:hypothetical protein
MLSTKKLTAEDAKVASICKLVNQKQIIPNQLTCCNSIWTSCHTNITDCFLYLHKNQSSDPRDSALTLCHDINDLSACRARVDETAKTICEKKDSLYCLFEGIPDKETDQGKLLNLVHPRYASAVT